MQPVEKGRDYLPKNDLTKANAEHVRDQTDTPTSVLIALACHGTREDTHETLICL